MLWEVKIFMNGKWIVSDILGSYIDCIGELVDLKEKGWLFDGLAIVLYCEQGISFLKSDDLEEELKSLEL